MSRGATWPAAAVLVFVLLAGQAVAGYSAPQAPRADAARVLGRAGFAYLGGLRTFAAAVLWNRLEPVFHGYYEGVPIREQAFALPTLYLVQTLDPQFEQSYYLAAYALAERGDMERALSLAKQGIENNPESGLMRANYVQIMLIQDREANLAEMRRQSDAGLRDTMKWASVDDLYEGLAIFRTVYHLAGEETTATRIRAAMAELRETGQLESHDHDGDGDQDH